MTRTIRIRRSGAVETSHVLVRLRRAYNKVTPLALSPGDVARLWNLLTYHEVRTVSVFNSRSQHGHMTLAYREEVRAKHRATKRGKAVGKSDVAVVKGNDRPPGS